MTSEYQDSVHWSSHLRAVLGGSFPRMGSRGVTLTKALFPIRLRARLFPSVEIDLDLADETMRSTYWTGPRFEYPTGQILQSWSDGADCFFDIGSNYGFFSWWLANFFPDLEIFPFEPNPKTFAKVNRTKHQNHLAHVHPQNCGLSDTVDTLLLHEGISDSGHSTFGAHPGLVDAPTVSVPVVPFDIWLQRQAISFPPTPSWVAKIDVEGFEMKVLSGMKSSLQAKAFRGLAIEINAFTLEMTGSKPEHIFDFLDSYGYRLKSGSQFPPCGNSFFEIAP